MLQMMNGEDAWAWNSLKWLQPHFAIDDALEKQSWETALQLENDGGNKLTMLFRWWSNKGKVEFFGVFWQKFWNEGKWEMRESEKICL